MRLKKIQLETIITAPAKTIFNAWLDSSEHGAIIGDSAEIEPKEGSKFSMWGGSISGVNLKIDSNKLEITQHWISEYDDWPKNLPSTLKLVFSPHGDNETRIHLSQTGIPEQHADSIKSGWEDFYWIPMKEYFSSK